MRFTLVSLALALTIGCAASTPTVKRQTPLTVKLTMDKACHTVDKRPPQAGRKDAMAEADFCAEIARALTHALAPRGFNVVEGDTSDLTGLVRASQSLMIENDKPILRVSVQLKIDGKAGEIEKLFAETDSSGSAKEQVNYAAKEIAKGLAESPRLRDL